MGWFQSLYRSGPPWCDDLDLATFTGYAGAISLLPCAVEGQGDRALAVAQRIDVLISRLCTADVLALDNAVRARSAWRGDWFSERSLAKVMPRHLPRYEGLFLCFALCHPSGYVRQSAVRTVAFRLRHDRLPSRAALALQLLVLRRNDWVPAVAASAAEALDALLEQGFPKLWARALPLVDRLPSLLRRGHVDFVEAVRARTSSEAWAPHLMARLHDPDRDVMRSALRAALTSSGVGPERALEAALVSSYPTARLMAARAAEGIVDEPQREGLLQQLDADSLMPVRREALRLRAVWFPDTLKAAQRRLLFDRSRTLRRVAQDAIACRGDDPAEDYRRGLPTHGATDVTICLLGLSEAGQSSDAPRAVSFVHAPRARTRAAALRCLASLAGGEFVEVFVAALEDVSARVCRAAATGLRDHGHLVGIGRLLAILDRATSEHTERAVIRLLFDHDPWAPLGPLIRRRADRDDPLYAWAGALLARWNRKYPGWTRPPAANRLVAFRSALAECAPRLEPDERRELEFLLSTLTPR